MLAVGSAASYGIADFCGGLATRGAHVLRVVAISAPASLLIELALLPRLGLIDTALLGAVVLLRQGHPANWTKPSALFAVLTVAWFVCSLALLALLGITPALTVARAQLPAGAMRVPALLAVPVAPMPSRAHRYLRRGGPTCSPGPFSLGVLPIGASASVIALGSSARGARSALVRS